MEVVLGIGDMGCAIVDNFKKQEEFEVYKINKKTRGNRSLSLKEQDNLEQYEKLAMQKADKIKEMFEDVEESDCVTVFVSGADKISGATLVVLESLKLQTDNIEVVCISPDKEFLNEEKKKNNNFVFGVLQEFARSGMIKMAHLVDLNKVEEILGDVPLTEYEQRLYELIASTCSMIKFYSNSKPLLDNRTQTKDISRIATYGISSFKNKVQEDLFYDLSESAEKIYYYGMSKKELENDGKLLRKIKTHVKSLDDAKTILSFAVFETSYEQNMVLCQVFTDKVQS